MPMPVNLETLLKDVVYSGFEFSNRGGVKEAYG